MTASLPVKLTRAATYLLLGLAAAVTLTPLLWLVAATTKGPTVMGMRGPMRWASCPARADSASMITVIGNNAAPASSAE